MNGAEWANEKLAKMTGSSVALATHPKTVRYYADGCFGVSDRRGFLVAVQSLGQWTHSFLVESLAHSTGRAESGDGRPRSAPSAPVDAWKRQRFMRLSRNRYLSRGRSGGIRRISQSGGKPRNRFVPCHRWAGEPLSCHLVRFGLAHPDSSSNLIRRTTKQMSESNAYRKSI